MKPCMHLVEISIFSLNFVIVRLTKIMNRADKNWAQFRQSILIHNQNFQKDFLIKAGLLVKYSSSKFFFWQESTNFRHWKMTLKLRILRSLTRMLIILVSLMLSIFPIDALVAWYPTWSKNSGRSLILNGHTDRLISIQIIQWCKIIKVPCFFMAIRQTCHLFCKISCFSVKIGNLVSFLNNHNLDHNLGTIVVVASVLYLQYIYSAMYAFYRSFKDIKPYLCSLTACVCMCVCV